MTTETNKAIVRRMVEEVQSRGNLDKMEEFFAHAFVDHSPMAGLPPTREGAKMLFGAIRAGLPDMTAAIHDQVAEGDKVVTRKTFTGTHRGALMGVAPTGKTITIEVIDILRLADGKIVEHWNLVDQLGLMQQLGAIRT
ncbi:MAG TPA: ester cyclase [Dehalococcoidia bacterium]|jgi:steroid delta-isomerase-like uncharacterized protein